MSRYDHTQLYSLARAPEEVAGWLSRWPFQRMVTLTFNKPGDGLMQTIEKSVDHMRDRLRKWDGRMNRKLVGKDYYNKPYACMFTFFAPEKISLNPHWHGLVHFMGDEDHAKRQMEIFDEQAALIWSKLVPSGTTDIKKIVDAGAVGYACKSLCMKVNLPYFVAPDEFRRAA
jgi:hypothetical protein